MLANQTAKDSCLFWNLKHSQVGILPRGCKFEPPLCDHDHCPWNGRQISGPLTIRVVLNQFTNLFPNHRPLKGSLTSPDSFLQQLPVDGRSLPYSLFFFFLAGGCII